jgi:flagellin
MIAHINHDLTGLAFETHRARMELDTSVAKLSSGKRMQNAKHDAGGFQQAAKLGSRHKRDVASMQNLQNLVSYSQIQDGSLETVGKIINRMNTLATRALDVTSTDGDRENYNKEFIELAAQLDEIKLEKFNDMDVFGAGGFSDEKQEFIDSLKNGWLKRSEELITAQYGWSVKPSDTWDLIVNENDTGGYAAFVMTSTVTSPGANFGTADVIEMQFDLPDFSAPHTQPTSEADRVVAHEMVHLMQAQNSYYGDLTGDGSSRATWFKEGLAEFIHGADNRVLGILGAAPTSGQIDALLAAIGTGNESWTTNEQYGAGYLAARYLHNQIKTATPPQSAGVKHLTQWMKTEFDAGNGAATSGLDTYLQTFTSYADTNAFITDFKSANGRNFVNTQIVPNLSNGDTGSIAGSDAGGGGALNGQSVVPDTAGTADSSPIYEVEKGSLAATIDGSGETWNLQSVNTITVSDTATYNLESISNARGTLTQLTAWMENLATERALVGANLSRLEKEMDNLSRKMGGREMAVSRIEDTDIARESTKFASNQVRMQASVAILAQAKQTNVMLADLVRGVNVGG